MDDLTGPWVSWYDISAQSCRVVRLQSSLQATTDWALLCVNCAHFPEPETPRIRNADLKMNNERGCGNLRLTLSLVWTHST